MPIDDDDDQDEDDNEQDGDDDDQDDDDDNEEARKLHSLLSPDRLTSTPTAPNHKEFNKNFQ